jgi:hypothetical protein
VALDLALTRRPVLVVVVSVRPAVLYGVVAPYVVREVGAAESEGGCGLDVIVVAAAVLASTSTAAVVATSVVSTIAMVPIAASTVSMSISIAVVSRPVVVVAPVLLPVCHLRLLHLMHHHCLLLHDLILVEDGDLCSLPVPTQFISHFLVGVILRLNFSL